jgi:hypothetical protein
LAKLDANGIFEGYFSNSTLNIGIVAYTDEDSFFATSVNKSLGSTGSYIDVDVSGDGVPSGAQLAFFEVLSTSTTTRNFAYRENGATYDYYSGIKDNSHGALLAVVGLDASRICEMKIANAAVGSYLWGYSANGDGYNGASPQDVTPTNVTTWETKTVTGCPANTKGVIVLLRNAAATTSQIAQVRKYGSSDSNLDGKVGASQQIFAFVGVDGSNQIQVYKGTADVTMFVVGWLTGTSTSIYNVSAALAAIGAAAIGAGGSTYNIGATLSAVAAASGVSRDSILVTALLAALASKSTAGGMSFEGAASLAAAAGTLAGALVGVSGSAALQVQATVALLSAGLFNAGAALAAGAGISIVGQNNLSAAINLAVVAALLAAGEVGTSALYESIAMAAQAGTSASALTIFNTLANLLATASLAPSTTAALEAAVIMLAAALLGAEGEIAGTGGEIADVFIEIIRRRRGCR